MVRSGILNRWLLVVVVVSSLLIAGVLVSKKSAETFYRQSQFLLDTLVEITVVSSDERAAEQAISAAYHEMHRIEALLSRHQATSQISLINQAAGESRFVEVTQEVGDLLQRALRFSERSDGFFDITIGPVIDAWGIGTQHERVPSQEELNRFLKYVNYQQITFSPEHGIRLESPGMLIDLGGIAKGYSIDRGIEVLRTHNVTKALINAGGDIRCLGTKPDGTPWRIGVRNSRNNSGILGVVSLENGAVATSGDYERYFIEDGIRYHHIFLPRTGMPARECQSVTVVAQTAEIADMLTTTLFTMGPERGLAFVEVQPHVEAMIVRAGGEYLFSSGFEFQPD